MTGRSLRGASRGGLGAQPSSDVHRPLPFQRFSSLYDVATWSEFTSSQDFAGKGVAGLFPSRTPRFPARKPQLQHIWSCSFLCVSFLPHRGACGVLLTFSRASLPILVPALCSIRQDRDLMYTTGAVTHPLSGSQALALPTCLAVTTCLTLLT